MSNLIEQSTFPAKRLLPPIENGEHLDQPAFHRRYQAMPNGFRAELIGGRVIVPSPLSAEHASIHALILGWLIQYVEQTPGTRALDNASLVLGQESEPQPDASLIVEPDFGGNVAINAHGYLAGAPELIVEIASSSQAYDLYEKRTDYQRAGVQEYAVVLIRDHVVRWFELEDNAYQERQADDDGVFRSRVFPGLWLRGLSLLESNLADLMATLREGIADASHAAFVKQLAARRSESK